MGGGGGVGGKNSNSLCAGIVIRANVLLLECSLQEDITCLENYRDTLNQNTVFQQKGVLFSFLVS